MAASRASAGSIHSSKLVVSSHRKIAGNETNEKVLLMKSLGQAAMRSAQKRRNLLEMSPAPSSSVTNICGHI
jgi:hypothetical protein